MFSNIIDMPSKWIEHVKDYAKAKGMTYRDALKCPMCKSAYKESKGGSVEAPPQVKENIEMKIKEIAKRGRPKKYATPEEAKKAKIEKTIESNKRKKVEGGSMKPIGMANPLSDPEFKKKYEALKKKDKVEEVVGKGILVAGYKNEADGGLTHIYPISHAHVLEILKHLA